ncbi:YdeI/OmpD-associated family protein [bacterium]|nr:YdeI/OmpD-associated family protein [bacterium]
MNYQIINDKPTLSVRSREEWRLWLSENHNDHDQMWLIIYKKHTGKQIMTKTEAMDEAICFGWIDSLVKGIDDEKYMQKFTPRKPDSQWSEVNKSRVAQLEAQGLIEPAGKALIEHARETGEWFVTRSTPKNIEMSPGLTKALGKSSGAKERWDTLPASHRRKYLQWISQAKREATKQNRIKKTIKMLTSGQSPSML